MHQAGHKRKDTRSKREDTRSKALQTDTKINNIRTTALKR